MIKCFSLLVHTFPLACLFLFPVFLPAQGLIVNEVSLGPASSLAAEYIELLVIGSKADPLGQVDVTGWIIDDNNGDFTLSGSGADITTGHIRIRGNCFNLLNPGDLIVIYNEVNKNLKIPADDLTDVNGDGVYIIPGNSTCLEVCTFNPTSANPAYLGCPFYIPGALWSRLDFLDAGDAAQVRRPNGTFYHGFSWGDVDATFPNFPSSASSFNVGAGGGGAHFEFLCGDYTAFSNFLRNTDASDSPGAANNPSNAATIVEIVAGNFDYANLSNVNNCGTILETKINRFEASVQDAQVNLQWEVFGDLAGAYFAVERSPKGQEFQVIQEMATADGKTQYQFVDQSPTKGENTYRIRMTDVNGHQSLSNSLKVVVVIDQFILKEIYPNPGSGQLYFSLELPELLPFSVHLYDIMGKAQYRETFMPDQHADTYRLNSQELPAGTYMLLFSSKYGQLYSKWVKL